MPESELRQFRSGRALLAEIKRIRRSARKMEKHAAALGVAAAAAMEHVVTQALDIHGQKS